MNSQCIYEFNAEDVNEVIKFCRDYHLDITKQAMGRTGSGPRGLGGEIDAFGPGKLNEIGIAKLISLYEQKICKVDNQIYSNYEVGIKTIPDIVSVVENKNTREPNLYVEIKKISENDHWLGIHSDQLNAILKNSKISTSEIYLIFGQIYFEDLNNRKQQDFLGSFLNSYLGTSNVKFNQFSNLQDLKCKIHYVLSISDLYKFGHEFKQGDIIPELNFTEAKQVFRSDGRLWKGLKLDRKFDGKKTVTALGINGENYEYGKFHIEGSAQLIKSASKSRQYLSFLENTILENEFFGRLEFKKGEVIFFNVNNMLAGLQGSKVKNKSDWWISRIKLDQLITRGDIKDTVVMLKEIQNRI